MMVDSGVEKENAEKAKEAILGQLEIMKKGEFSDFEFSSAVKSIKDSLRSYNDSQNGLDVWYTLKAINKNVYSPEEISEKIEKITRQDVIDAANRVKLNTVYMLLPKEKEGV
jgi:predicted Zn-dependent peptidase